MINIHLDIFHYDRRYASPFARWGFSKGTTSHRMPWGRRIEAGKRYGTSVGRRFNMNRFRSGGYNEIDAVKRYVMDVRNMLLRTGYSNGDNESKRIGMAAGRRFNMNQFRQGNYMRYSTGK